MAKQHYYSDSDKDFIIQQRKDGVAIPQIAKKINRTAGSVSACIKKMRIKGVSVPTTRNTHPKREGKKQPVKAKKNNDGTLYIAENDRPQKVRVQVDRRTSYMVAPEKVAEFKERIRLEQIEKNKVTRKSQIRIAI